MVMIVVMVRVVIYGRMIWNSGFGDRGWGTAIDGRYSIPFIPRAAGAPSLPQELMDCNEATTGEAVVPTVKSPSTEPVTTRWLRGWYARHVTGAWCGASALVLMGVGLHGSGGAARLRPLPELDGPVLRVALAHKGAHLHSEQGPPESNVRHAGRGRGGHKGNMTRHWRGWGRRREERPRLLQASRRRH